MKTIRLRIIALTSFCLLTVPALSFAQIAPAPTAPHADHTSIASARDASVPSLEDLGLAQTPIAPIAPILDASQNTTQGQTTSADQKNQAPASSNAPSLQDLGFTPSQTQANAQLQATLDKRTHMLKIHQRLGLITIIPLVATVIASGGAKQKKDKATGSTTIIEPSSANVDLHAALGSLTAGMYVSTAYFAIRAPRVPGTKTRGAIRLHKTLAFIHGPGMILTPILGAMALDQENKGEKVHGIASAHSYVAWTTVAAYGAAIVSVSWPIKLKF